MHKFVFHSMRHVTAGIRIQSPKLKISFNISIHRIFSVKYVLKGTLTKFLEIRDYSSVWFILSLTLGFSKFQESKITTNMHGF